jgi:small subunit ribosomal protein S12
MATINQVARFGRCQKVKWSSVVKLEKCPFKQGIVSVVYIGSPKKPNSGKRKLAKVVLSTGRRAIVTIPDGGQTLQKYNRVLIRGGRARDVPGSHYKILRTMKGRINDTMGGSVHRKQRRSKFGTMRLV